MEPCGPENFTQTFTDFGVCYTFNNPKKKEDVRYVQQTGFDYGLFLRLNVEQWEYYNSYNTGAGVKVVHQNMQGRIGPGPPQKHTVGPPGPPESPY